MQQWQPVPLSARDGRFRGAPTRHVRERAAAASWREINGPTVSRGRVLDSSLAAAAATDVPMGGSERAVASPATTRCVLPSQAPEARSKDTPGNHCKCGGTDSHGAHGYALFFSQETKVFAT